MKNPIPLTLPCLGNKNQGTFDFINKINKKKGHLGSHCVKSGGRESGGRESRATDFGAEQAH